MKAGGKRKYLRTGIKASVPGIKRKHVVADESNRDQVLQDLAARTRIQDFMLWGLGSHRKVRMCYLNFKGITLAIGCLVRKAIQGVAME